LTDEADEELIRIKPYGGKSAARRNRALDPATQHG
jgi:hypothetical protein